MMKYQEIIDAILKDDVYLNWMKKIDEIVYDFACTNEENGKITFDHGLYHAKRVAFLTTKFLKELKADEQMLFLGEIASLLHDVGIINGKKNHAKTGAEMIKEYLLKFDLSQEEKDLVVNAVERHGKSENAKTLLDYALVLADKCDYDKNRLTKGPYVEKAYLNKILKNEIEIKENQLILKYETTKDFDNSVFYTIPKSIDEPFKIGERLGLEVLFYVNGEKEDFKDRKDYNGFVYKGSNHTLK